MENLWLLSNLTKLQMDNNIIERIEGLDTLHRLTWLGKSDNARLFVPHAFSFDL